MYKVGIIGHSTENFIDQDSAARSVKRAIDLVYHQYGRLNHFLNIDGMIEYRNDSLVINIPATLGAGLWAGLACLESKVKYHLFLPFPHEITSQFWYDGQKAELNSLFRCSYETSTQSFDTIDGDKAIMATNRAVIDNSNFIIAFWEQGRVGKTADSIKYALNSNKLVLNGMEELELITNADFKKR